MKQCFRRTVPLRSDIFRANDEKGVSNDRFGNTGLTFVNGESLRVTTAESYVVAVCRRARDYGRKVSKVTFLNRTCCQM